MSESVGFTRGRKYRFINQSDTPDLMYVGLCDLGYWLQFTKYEEGRWGKVWSEIAWEDSHMIEEVEENDQKNQSTD